MTTKKNNRQFTNHEPRINILTDHTSRALGRKCAIQENRVPGEGNSAGHGLPCPYKSHCKASGVKT